MVIFFGRRIGAGFYLCKWLSTLDGVSFNIAPLHVVIGKEGEDNWMMKSPSQTEWTGEAGWGYAKVRFITENIIKLKIKD